MRSRAAGAESELMMASTVLPDTDPKKALGVGRPRAFSMVVLEQKIGNNKA
ncbi:MAG: hypothetical protein NTAFB05_03140 [Nitrobacter sp.]